MVRLLRTWVVRLAITGEEIVRVEAATREEALGHAIRALASAARQAARLVVRPLWRLERAGRQFVELERIFLWASRRTQ
jgi:hypothetical protein